jgi:hypothetical protein
MYGKNYLGYIIPEKYHEKEVLIDLAHKSGLKNPNCHYGKFYYTFNHLRTTPHLEKTNNDDGWVSMDTSVIKDVFGDLQYYNAIMDTLIADKYVEPFISAEGKGSYSTKYHHCKKYRLTPLINEEPWSVIKVYGSNCKTTKNILDFYKQGLKPIDRHLFNLLTEFKIDNIDFFDKTTAKNFTKFPCEMLDIIKEKVKDKKKKIENIYNAYSDAYKFIKKDCFRFNVGRTGRRHTNITNLPKALRKYLYVLRNGKKQRLIVVDVVNCQVLLLLTILPEKLPTYKKFKQKVEDGVFYEFLAAGMGIVGEGENGSLSEAQRKKVKNRYFKFIYGDHKYRFAKSSPVYKVMIKEFPDIVKFLENKKNKQGYAKVPQLMQKAESDIIIHSVCKKAIGKKFLFTQIYDSIMCLPENVNEIETIMTEAFKDKKMNVKLKIEQ